MIDKKFTYALIGASANPEKFGYKILNDLLGAGYNVFPVNPVEKQILGRVVFPNLSSISTSINVVIFVVPPAITEKVLDEVISLGIKNVWMQPGSESESAITKCLVHGISLVHNSCIMIQRK